MSFRVIFHIKITFTKLNAPVVKPTVRLSQITRLGETNYFALDYDDKDKIVALYGKEIPKDSSSRLKLSFNETVAVYRLLGKALDIMRNNPWSVRVGENSSFIVDYDEKCKKILLYQKEQMPLCQFKLALDDYETIMIIHYLKKARNFFWK